MKPTCIEYTNEYVYNIHECRLSVCRQASIRPLKYKINANEILLLI